jgi:hypothetical protein
LREQIPPSKKDLKKLELFNAVLASSGGAPVPDPSSDGDSPSVEAADVGEADQEAVSSDDKKSRSRVKKA